MRFSLLCSFPAVQNAKTLKLTAFGRAVVAEEHETGVVALGDLGQEVEPSIEVEEEALWVPLLGADCDTEME